VTDVRLVFRKWPDQPHWEFDTFALGEDQHGTWLGSPSGTLMSRPGSTFVTDQPQVVLVPQDQPFVATFYGTGGSAHCVVYVDMTTVPVHLDAEVRVIDLDLDVVKDWTGRIWVDDEDEFAARRIRFGYPSEIVRLATTSCESVVAAMTDARPPYDGVVSDHWLERLDVAMMDR
jgi:uncharacterized protein